MGKVKFIYYGRYAGNFKNLINGKYYTFGCDSNNYYCLNEEGNIQDVSLMAVNHVKKINVIDTVKFIAKDTEFFPELNYDEDYSLFSVIQKNGMPYYRIAVYGCSLKEYPACLFKKVNSKSNFADSKELEEKLPKIRKLIEMDKKQEEESKLKVKLEKEKLEAKEKENKLYCKNLKKYIEIISDNAITVKEIENAPILKDNINKFSYFLIICTILYTILIINIPNLNALAIKILGIVTISLIALGINKYMKHIVESNRGKSYLLYNYTVPYDLISDEILAKIKKIEINICRIKKTGVSSEMTNLLIETFGITINLIDKNTITEIKDISEFLDSMLKYTEELINNEDTQENLIKMKIAENFADILKKNKSIFDSMAKDNKIINSHLKKIRG